jgi:hypothetical protein
VGADRTRIEQPQLRRLQSAIASTAGAAVALGGDCLADIAVLLEQPQLAGPVASDPVASRLVSALAADLPRALKAICLAAAPPLRSEPALVRVQASNQPSRPRRRPYMTVQPGSGSD